MAQAYGISGFAPIDGGAAARAERNAYFIRLARFFVATFAGFTIFMTFTPFPAGASPDPAAEGAGNVINQIGYIGVSGLGLAALMTLAERTRLLFLLNWRWGLIAAILFMAAAQNPYFDPALRGVILTLCAMLITASIVLLPQTEKDFRTALSVTVLAVLAVSYGGVIVRPDLAVHDGVGPEGHLGLWRGVYSHKNFAGPVMAGFALFGIYVFRSGERLTGLAITVLAAYFVVKTGSKTTVGFLPLSVLVVYQRRLFGSASLVIAGHILAVLLVATLSIGSAFSERIEKVTAYVIEDTTFTGRDDVWRFGVANLPEGPFESYGYFGFWGTEVPLRQEVDPVAAWDVRPVVSGHTNYIDTFLNYGYVPGAILLVILLVLPAFHYRRACKNANHTRLADFFMMTVNLMGMISCLETFFFARAMPPWVIMFLAIFGLSALGSRHLMLWPAQPA